MSSSGSLIGRRRALALLGCGCAAAALPGCIAVPASPAHGLDLADLEERDGGRLGVAALDFASGERIDWRGRERFPYCSTFKLFLAAATLERVQRGEERLDRRIAITAEDIVHHHPVTGNVVGGILTIAGLAEAAVSVSDNPAANILIREMGGLETWRAWYPSIGDRTTRVDRWETALNSALPGDPRDTALPVQTVANLAAVFAPGRLDEEYRRLLLGWAIRSPAGAARIRSTVPDDALVAHKIGTGARGSTNDIGLVWMPARAPVAIAIYYTGAAEASAMSREATVAEAAWRVLRTLGALPPPGDDR